jgi:hypothetical protein
MNRLDRTAVLYASMLAMLTAPPWSALAGTSAQTPPEASVIAEEYSPAAACFRWLDDRLEAAVTRADHVAGVADDVAGRFMGTSELLLAPTQDSFLFEQWGRAGGLTAATKWRPERGAPPPQSLVLLAVEPTLDYPGRHADWITQALSRGATVVAFSDPNDLRLAKDPNGRPYGPEDFHAVIPNGGDANRLRFDLPGEAPGTLELSGLMNLVNGWMFAGELAAACTRRGEMPIFWESLALDKRKDNERVRRYSKSISPGRDWGPQMAFHDDMKIDPIAREVLARRYIEQLQTMSRDIRAEKWSLLMDAAERATRIIQDGGDVYLYAIGHAMPWDPPADERREVFTVIGGPHRGRAKPYQRHAGKGDMLILLCMPTFNEKMVEDARRRGCDVVVMSTERPSRRRLRRTSDHYLWIPAPWPMNDGAVAVEGYDIRILPVTGVMNTLIYYALREEVRYRLAAASLPAGTSAQAPAMD